MLGIVCAGGRASPRLASLGVERVPLIDLGGQTILDKTCSALLDAGCSQVAVLAPPEVSMPEMAGVSRAEHNGNLIESLVRCLQTYHEESEALISSCDLPLISADACKEVLHSGQACGAGLVYPIFNRQEVEARFGGAKRTYARLSGTEYTGGNVFYVQTGWIGKQQALLTRLFELRKSPTGLAKVFGLGFLLRLLLGRLTIQTAERRLSRVVGTDLRAVPMHCVELGMDVDKPEDLEALGIRP